MKIEIRHEDGSATPLLIAPDPSTQLFDVIFAPKNDGSGNYDLYLVTTRLWIDGVLTFEVTVFDGTSTDRLRILKASGYVA